MKPSISVPLLTVIAVFVGYLFYLNKPTINTITDVSKPESFRVYKKVSGEPVNIDLSVYGSVDSAFNIRVVGLPGQAELLNADLNGKQVNYSRKIDYYSGKGVDVFYTPKVSTRGDVEVSVRIN